jgi:PilZ domain
VPPHASLPFSHEKRRHPRLETKIPIKISNDQGDILTETRNLSCSGAFCRVDRRLEVMSKLKIHLLLPFRKNEDKVVTKKVSCQGVIVRVQAAADGEHYDAAIFFNDIAPKDALAISEFIENVLESRRMAGPSDDTVSSGQNYGQYN